MVLEPDGSARFLESRPSVPLGRTLRRISIWPGPRFAARRPGPSSRGLRALGEAIWYAIVAGITALVVWRAAVTVSGELGWSDLWKALGLGAITPVTFIRWQLPSRGTRALITNVLVANVPQVVLSFIYFAYNALFTCMSLAAEWSRFALERKGGKLPVRVDEVLHLVSQPASARPN